MNIVLIVIDTVRKDHLTPYGKRGFPTESIERFAGEAVMYRNVISPAPWTTPVHASLFTGLYPSRHGTHGENLNFDSKQSCPSLMRILRENGYRCVGISSNYLISDQFGFSRDFDRFLQTWQGVPQSWDRYHFTRPDFQTATKLRKLLSLSRDLLNPVETWNVVKSLINRRFMRKYDVIENATVSTLRALEWGKRVLRHRNDKPVFLFLNLMQAHEKFNPPREIRAELCIGDDPCDCDTWGYYAGKEDFCEEDLALRSQLYAGEIYFLDRCIGEFLEFLRRLPDWDDMLVVMLSDHGELLGEHGMLGHLIGLFGELIDVPLLVKYPRGAREVDEDQGLWQSHDLFTTILDLAGAHNGQETDSISLIGSPGRKEVISQVISNGFLIDEIHKQGGELRKDLLSYAKPMMAVIRDGMKYVLAEGGDYWLFDLSADPGENTNLVDDPRYIDTLRTYQTVMEAAMKRTSFVPSIRESRMEETVIQRLKAMGYI